MLTVRDMCTWTRMDVTVGRKEMYIEAPQWKTRTDHRFYDKAFAVMAGDASRRQRGGTVDSVNIIISHGLSSHTWHNIVRRRDARS